MAGDGPSWYAPTDSWPPHSHAWFRTALKKARSAGWWYRKAAGSAHIHGVAYCLGPDNRAGACKFVVYSTGKSGEDAATDFERLMRRCPHRERDVGALVEASRRMDRVELLCAGAEALLDRDDIEQEAAALLDRAEQLLDEAGDGAEVVDDLLRAVLDLEFDARAADDAAERAFVLATTDLREPSEVLDAADEVSGQVRAALIEEDPSSEVRNLRLRVRDARVKIQSLRRRLSQK